MHKQIKNQAGFGVVEVLLLLVVATMVAGIGYYTWTQTKTNTSESNAEKASASTVAISDKSNESPTETPTPTPFYTIGADGWKTATLGAITVSYPARWDDVGEDFMKFKVGSKNEGNIVGTGFGSPYGYEYLGNGKWQYITTIEGGSVSPKYVDLQPDAAPATVNGSETTVLIRGGDGPCGGKKIVFVVSGNIYSVHLPWECDESFGGSSIEAQDIEDNLVRIIESIRIK